MINPPTYSPIKSNYYEKDYDGTDVSGKPDYVANTKWTAKTLKLRIDGYYSTEYELYYFDRQQ